MAMDALTLKAFEALSLEILPRLQSSLQKAAGVDSAERIADTELRSLVRESYELLALLSGWSEGQGTRGFLSVSAPTTPSATLVESDEEAMELLASLEKRHPSQDVLQGQAEIKGSNPGDQNESLSEIDSSSQDEMSNDEAMNALAAMDGESVPAEVGMSDQDALAALADMDGTSDPVLEEMSDEAAMAALAGMDGADESSTDGVMSDEAAMAALAGMDEPAGEQEPGPATVTPQAKAPVEEDVEEIEEFGTSEFGSDPEMIKDFITNADDLMEKLDEQILALEQNPRDKEIINEIFRSAHTLKGAAGMFAYHATERIMHRMENYFDQIVKGKQIVNGDAIDVILRSMDILKTLQDGVKAGKRTGVKTAPMVKLLNQLCAGQLDLNAEKSEVNSEPDEQPSSQEAAPEQAKATAAKVTQSTIRVDLQRLDALVNLVGELVIDRTRFLNIEEQLRTRDPDPQLSTNMTETVQLFGRHMNEVQDIIMKVRMVPIGNAFSKFSRVIRDLSKGLKKEIELITHGENTELDKTIVEQIGDPLIHLIRNSVDHGVEDPATREANGKDRKGTVTLSARQEGNQIMITIQDDGKGMDREIIRAKGVEKGLVGEDESLSDRDIFNLIFEPGFSTAAQVTNISGRGVGMDVVKKQIAKLKGVVDIVSEVNVGTTISIQLPLTLAIVQSLLVKSKNEIFAIPLSAVVESLRIQPGDIQHVGDSEVIKRRNRVLPLLYLHEALDLETKAVDFWYDMPCDTNEEQQASRRKKNLDDRKFVVVVGTEERRFGIVVDSLLNQQEMVIKSMGHLMGGIPCVAGGAILGNGEVVLVLDIGELEGHFRNKGRTQVAA